MSGPGDARYWDERYQAADAPWDLGAPAPPFVAFATGDGAPAPGQMIVLGCGRGHDAIFFAQQGYDVTAMDFAPTAIEAARRSAEDAGVAITFEQQDIFALPISYRSAFDYVLEHTCFAAISPELREEYVEAVYSLLKPGGLYIALLFAHGRSGGPPFTTDLDEAHALFSSRFSIERLEIADNSVGPRLGKELFGLMRPR